MKKNATRNDKAMLRTCIVAALCVCGRGTVHATFGRAQGMSLCRRQACKGDVRATTTVARLALEHPSAFSVASEEDDRIALFVVVPIGRHIHRIDAVMWPEGAHLSKRFRALRKWHAASYTDHILIPGDVLPPDEQRAWEDDR